MVWVARGLPTTLPLSVPGEDGPVTFAAAPTVTVRDPDGAVVGAPGAAGGTAGVYTFPLAPVTRLGAYTATLAGTVSGAAVSLTVAFQVVSGHLFTLADLRASDAALTVDDYPDAAVKSARDYVVDEFDMITYREFNLRGSLETLPLDSGRFWLGRTEPYRMVSVKVDGVTVDVSTVSFGFAGDCVYSGGGDGVVTVEYEYGMPVVPADVKRAAVRRAATILYERDSGIPDRATSFQVDNGGSYTLATAGRAGFETGIPDVDAVLSRYTVKPPGVA